MKFYIISDAADPLFWAIGVSESMGCVKKPSA
jgi:hypothetical protein